MQDLLIHFAPANNPKNFQTMTFFEFSQIAINICREYSEKGISGKARIMYNDDVFALSFNGKGYLDVTNALNKAKLLLSDKVLFVGMTSLNSGLIAVKNDLQINVIKEFYEYNIECSQECEMHSYFVFLKSKESEFVMHSAFKNDYKPYHKEMNFKDYEDESINKYKGFDFTKR